MTIVYLHVGYARFVEVSFSLEQHQIETFSKLMKKLSKITYQLLIKSSWSNTGLSKQHPTFLILLIWSFFDLEL